MKKNLLAIVGITLFLAALLYGWHDKGHERAAYVATDALDGKLPAFFTAGRDVVAHCATDPDIFKEKTKASFLDAVEKPEHFIDLEMLKGMPLPADRIGYIKLCQQHDIDPYVAGFLPYALGEWTDRLTIAFAEHRKWPEDKIIQDKCRVYAGILAHYAADACMPLHTTIHYDGRLQDGKSPHSGIHLKVDALIEKLSSEQTQAVAITDLKPFADLYAGINEAIMASHALVDKVYELEDQYPKISEPLSATASKEAIALAQKCLEASATFTARLYLTAWESSADVAMPAWHNR